MEEMDAATRRQYLAEFDRQHRRATLYFLSKLTQTTTVADYQAAFEDLIDGVPGFSESILVSYFISGLRLEIRREILCTGSWPSTLVEAVALARTCEARVEATHSDLPIVSSIHPDPAAPLVPSPPPLSGNASSSSPCPPPTTTLLAPPKATHIISIPPSPTPMPPPSPVAPKTNPMPSSPPSLSPTPPPPPSQKNHPLISPPSIFPLSVRSPHRFSDDPLLSNPSPFSNPPPDPPDPPSYLAKSSNDLVLISHNAIELSRGSMKSDSDLIVKRNVEPSPEPDLNPKEKTKELTNAQEEHINRSNRTRNVGSAASSEKRGPANFLKLRYASMDHYEYDWRIVKGGWDATNMFLKGMKMQWIKSNVITKTLLLSRLVRVKRFDHTTKVFDEMPLKSFVPFSHMICGFASNGFCNEYLQLFLGMQRSCIHPDSITFVAMYIDPSGLLFLRTMEFKPGEVRKYGFESKDFEGTALVDAYARYRKVIDSYTVLEEMNSSSLASSHEMNLAIRLRDLYEELLLLLNQMRVIRVMLNAISMLKSSHICIDNGSSELYTGEHAYIVGLSSPASMRNTVIEVNLSIENSEMEMCFFSKVKINRFINWTLMNIFYLEMGGTAGARDGFFEITANGAGSFSQFMEFCCTFSKGLDMKKDQHDAIFPEIERGHDGEISSVVVEHAKVLHLSQLSHMDALELVITGKYTSIEHRVGVDKMEVADHLMGNISQASSLMKALNMSQALFCLPYNLTPEEHTLAIFINIEAHQAVCDVLFSDATTSGFKTDNSQRGHTRGPALLAFILGVKQMTCCGNRRKILRRFLIHWSGRPPEGSTWRSIESLCERYPTLHLEDKVHLKSGGVDTTLLMLLNTWRKSDHWINVGVRILSCFSFVIKYNYWLLCQPCFVL